MQLGQRRYIEMTSVQRQRMYRYHRLSVEQTNINQWLSDGLIDADLYQEMLESVFYQRRALIREETEGWIMTHPDTEQCQKRKINWEKEGF